MSTGLASYGPHSQLTYHLHISGFTKPKQTLPSHRCPALQHPAQRIRVAWMSRKGGAAIPLQQMLQTFVTNEPVVLHSFRILVPAAFPSILCGSGSCLRCFRELLFCVLAGLLDRRFPFHGSTAGFQLVSASSLLHLSIDFGVSELCKMLSKQRSESQDCCLSYAWQCI